jgi:hypothetical protein
MVAGLSASQVYTRKMHAAPTDDSCDGVIFPHSRLSKAISVTAAVSDEHRVMSNSAVALRTATHGGIASPLALEEHICEGGHDARHRSHAARVRNRRP